MPPRGLVPPTRGGDFFSNKSKTPLRLAWFERGYFAQEGAQCGFGRARF